MMKVYVLYYPTIYDGVVVVGVVDSEVLAKEWIEDDPDCNDYTEFYINNVEF